MPANESREGQQPTFEQALDRLKEINERFEKGELTLKEAIRLYQEGSQLAEICEKQLSEADQVVKRVVEEPAGTISEQEFEPAQG